MHGTFTKPASPRVTWRICFVIRPNDRTPWQKTTGEDYEKKYRSAVCRGLPHIGPRLESFNTPNIEGRALYQRKGRRGFIENGVWRLIEDWDANLHGVFEEFLATLPAEEQTPLPIAA